MTFDGEKFGSKIVDAIRPHVDGQIKTVSDRLADLERRVAYLEGFLQIPSGIAVADPVPTTNPPIGTAPPVSDGSKRVTRLPKERKRRA